MTRATDTLQLSPNAISSGAEGSHIESSSSISHRDVGRRHTMSQPSPDGSLTAGLGCAVT